MVALKQPDRVVVSIEVTAGNVNPAVGDQCMAQSDEVQSRRSVVAVGGIADVQPGQHDMSRLWRPTGSQVPNR